MGIAHVRSFFLYATLVYFFCAAARYIQYCTMGDQPWVMSKCYMYKCESQARSESITRNLALLYMRAYGT